MLNKMKNILLIIILGISVVACTPTHDAESVKADIKEKQATIEELTAQINELNAELQEMSGNQVYSGKKVSVKTMEAVKEEFDHFFTATGEIESVNEAFISPEVNGQVVKIAVKEGQKVRKGQLLAKLNTSLIEKNIQEIKTQKAFAKTMYDKQSDLWKRNIGSERQYLEAKNNYESLENKYQTLKTQYDMSVITSPFAGVIEDIMVKEGELAGPGVRIMQLVSLDELIIKARLSEAYLSSIKEGKTVELTFPSYPELNMQATVSRTGNVIHKQNRTFIVEIKINNTGNELKPNMLVNVLFNDYSGNDNFVVPSVLIKKDLKGRYLYVVNNEGENKTAAKRYIETGRSYKDKTEVISGLSTGDLIITAGYNHVSDGSIISIIN